MAGPENGLIKSDAPDDPFEITETIQSLMDEYHRQAHGMQSGVAIENSRHHPDYDHLKHLRVGVNSAMVETSALVRLMVRKGIFTYEEWWQTLVEAMTAEKAAYEQRYGVTLH